MLAALSLGLLSWIAEAVADHYAFKSGRGGLSGSLVASSWQEFCARSVVVLVFLALGFVIARALVHRKQAEEALRESESKYKSLVENTSDLVWEVDHECTYTYVSPRVHELLGYTPEDLVGKTAFDLMPEEEASRVLSLFSDIAGKRAPIEKLENTMVRLDGGFVVVESSGVPIMDDSGSLRGYRGIDRDITERRKAEDSLKELDEHKRIFYRETILSVTDGKLSICGDDAIKPYIDGASIAVEVNDASGVSEARGDIERLCCSIGLESEKVDLLLLGAGEAITNAVKHAACGHIYAGWSQDSIWVVVSDQGQGIDSVILPKAVLKRGFSTRPSLGLGYGIMLDVSDRVLLSTGSSGTTVVLILNRQSTEPSFSLDMIPDTWETI